MDDVERSILSLPPTALLGDQIALATFEALVVKFGPGFAHDVRARIIERADRDAKSDDPVLRHNAPAVRAIGENDEGWTAFLTRISAP